MNEHESAIASLFGTQLKRHECRECEREPGVARLAQCAAEDLGETSLGGGWEGTTLNTRAPSRPQLKRQDPRKWIFCPRILRTSSRLCPSRVFPAGRV